MLQDGRRRVQSNPDLWRHIIFFLLLTETKSHCNGFYSHSATAPKIHPSVEQNLSAPFLASHVAGGCYTLNLRLAFFCGQSSCSVQSNHPHLDNGSDSCRRGKGGFSPTHERVFIGNSVPSEGVCATYGLFAVVICILITVCSILSFKCGGD